MAEYIKRDELLELIDYYILHDEDAIKHHSALFVEGMKDGYYRMRSKAIDISASDVVEVVHGEWIYFKNAYGKDYRKCSNCLHEQEITGLLNYCPICGAKMSTQSNAFSTH